MRSRILLITAMILLVAMLPQAALGAVVGQQAPGEGNLGFLLAGSLAVWAGFFAYAFYLARKNQALQRELEELRQSLQEQKTGR